MNEAQTRDVAACDRNIAQQRAYKRAINSATYARIAQFVVNEPGHGGHWLTPYMSDSQITFYLSLSQLNTFADPRLTALLKALSAPALRLSAGRMDEAKDSFQRTYYFAAQVAGVRIRVVVTAYESEESSACQRVLVGMKKIETPIYEYKCLDVIATEVPAPVLLEGL